MVAGLFEPSLLRPLPRMVAAGGFLFTKLLVDSLVRAFLMITNVREADCVKLMAAIDAVCALRGIELAGLPVMLLDKAQKQFLAASVSARRAMWVRVEEDSKPATAE